MAAASPSLRTITLGGGCFWCIEGAFSRVRGVARAVSGYMGGSVPRPTYRQVCGGQTGHAEVVQVTYDPAVIATSRILYYFWRVHDPTTLNRQGNDVGTQYRSVIFYHDDEQRDAAIASIAELQKTLADPIVTEVRPVETFYEAEDYHQDYFTKNPGEGYCQYVVRPKIEKIIQLQKA